MKRLRSQSTEVAGHEENPSGPRKASTSSGRLKTPTISKLLLGLGALSVYNVFQHYQTIIDLSASVHWLAAWWRFIIATPYKLLGLHLTPVQRDAITLLLFFTTAASYALYSRFGTRAFRIWWTALKGYPDWGDSDFKIALFRRGEESKWSIVYDLLFFIATNFMIVLTIPSNAQRMAPSFAATISIFLFLMMVVVTAGGFHRSPQWLRYCAAVARFLLLPFFVVLNWLLILLSFRTAIVRSLGLLLIVLVLDFLAKYTLDPLITAFPTLPAPPPV